MSSGRTTIRLTIVVLVAVIFVADTLTRLEIAAGVLYVAPILLGVRSLPRRGVLALSALCLVLIVASLLLTETGAREAGIINMAISMAAVSVSTWLALRMIAAEAAFHEARAQLLRVARVTSMGQLTASIAHEVNQPLAAVATSADAALRWLEATPPDTARAIEGLRRIGSDAVRASEVVTRMRGLARHEPPSRDWADLNAIVDGALALARAELERHAITVRSDLDPGVPALRLDRVQIEQVLVNLILNAIEAMNAVTPGGRELSVTTSIRDRHVIVSVSDTGAGVREADLPRVFDAFWTTKHGGTGLGLTIGRSIVEVHGGLLRAERRPGGGTAFVIDFNP